MTMSLRSKTKLLVVILLLVSALVPLAALSGANQIKRVNERIQEPFFISVRLARQGETAFISYDDVLFRYLFTGDKQWLDQAILRRNQVQAALTALATFCDDPVEQGVLDSILNYWRSYEQGVQHLQAGLEMGTGLDVIRTQELDPDHSLRDQIAGLFERLIEGSESELKQYSQHAAHTLKLHTLLSWVLLVISMGSAFLIVLIANRTVFRPLSRLFRGIAEFRRGHYSHRVQVEGDDEIGAIAHALNALAQSVQEEHRKLEAASLTDSLTGLANSRYFWMRAQEETRRATRHGTPLSLVLIDVDFFKEYNDRHGHQFGDQVLASLGRVLKRSVRAEDIVARYGGEEFTVLLPGTGLEEATKMAERLRQSIAAAGLVVDARCHPLTVSVGVAAFRPSMTSAGMLVEAADRALYEAKDHGRNCVWAENERQGEAAAG